ncbi:MAG: hypothetical protein HQK76_20605, partial [Desulfobacterales bacterium]|nr:hypothetical protein [Desulfobacterales bacterium]
EAKSLAAQRDTKSINDPKIHLMWADLFEELGFIEDLIIELNLTIRGNPSYLPIYKRLADVYLDQGSTDKAIHCYSSIIKYEPLKANHYKGLAHILEESGDYEKALKVYQLGYEKTKDESFKHLIRSLDFLKKDNYEKQQEPVDTGNQIVPSQNNLVTFTSLFSGREGVYARQWLSPTGETGYTPVKEPFILKVAENHILGNLTAGIYQLRLDNTVNFIAFDLDIPKFILNKVIARQNLWKKAMETIYDSAFKIANLGAANNIPIYMEDSGFKGMHCWIFLEVPIPAGVAKKFGDVLLAQITGLTHEVSIEIFPKQTRVKEGGLGNLIKAPLGFHKKTGKRSLFISQDGNPHKNQLEFLESSTKASRRSIYAMIQNFNASSLSSSVPATLKQSSKYEQVTVHIEEESIQDERSIRKLKEAKEYISDNDTQLQYLLMKCPAIKAIIDKANLECSITKEERMVIIHSIGHLDNGADAVNDILQKCVNADPLLFMKSKLRGNPVSCPRIRSRIPEITSKTACNCQFDPSINLYPTPLLHVYAMKSGNQAVAKTTPTGMAADSVHFHNILDEYVKLKKQAREVDILIKKSESQINDFFEQAGIDSFSTSIGELKRIKKEDETYSFSLNI